MEEDERYTRITLRIPKDLHARITREAFITSKSQNAEIIARLEGSFDQHAASPLPDYVQDAMSHEIKERGGTPDEALTRLVQIAQAQGGTVFNLTVPADMKMGQLVELLQASKTVIPADANISITRVSTPAAY